MFLTLVALDFLLTPFPAVVIVLILPRASLLRIWFCSLPITPTDTARARWPSTGGNDVKKPFPRLLIITIHPFNSFGAMVPYMGPIFVIRYAMRCLKKIPSD